MPQGGASLHGAAEISNGGVAALKEHLRIGDIGPRGQLHFFRRGMVLEMAFDLFVIHAAKIGNKRARVKVGEVFLLYLVPVLF